VHPLEEVEGSFSLPDLAKGRGFWSSLLRVRNDGGFCVIDRKRYFVRGMLAFDVQGWTDGYCWGMWAEVDRDTWRHLERRRDEEGREHDPPERGRLANELPLFGQPLTGLEVSIHQQPAGLAPHFRVLDAAHPVAREQAAGISLARVMQFNHFVVSGDR
jgi:hypothetical protein